MGNCIYCGEKAGIFKDKHDECFNKYQLGIQTIQNLPENYYINKKDISGILDEAKIISKESYIKDENLKKALYNGVDKLIESFLENGIITKEEEEIYVNLQEKLELSPTSELNTKVVKGIMLRDLMEGKIPDRVELKGKLPVQIEKNETVVYLSKNVSIYYLVKVTTREGQGYGTSFKLAKGLYIRRSYFKSNPVVNESIQHVSDGSLLITNKNLYFFNNLSAFVIPYSKILLVNNFDDGIGIQQKAKSEKPVYFKFEDAWFMCNLINNLIELSKE